MGLPVGTPTGHMRSQVSGIERNDKKRKLTMFNFCFQVTAAQVETYQTKKYVDDSPSVQDPQDSSRSASPGPNMWKSPRGGYVPGHAHHDTHISGKKYGTSGRCTSHDFIGFPDFVLLFLLLLKLGEIWRFCFCFQVLCPPRFVASFIGSTSRSVRSYGLSFCFNTSINHS